MRQENGMATRTPQGPGRNPGESCTEFQLHKTQLSASSRKNLFDYTEYRLKRYIAQLKDEQKTALLKVLKEYKQGLVAIAWKSGKPVWISVTKG